MSDYYDPVKIEINGRRIKFDSLDYESTRDWERNRGNSLVAVLNQGKFEIALDITEDQDWQALQEARKRGEFLSRRFFIISTEILKSCK